jgi:hypothetical protein
MPLAPGFELIPWTEIPRREAVGCQGLPDLCGPSVKPMNAPRREVSHKLR